MCNGNTVNNMESNIMLAENISMLSGKRCTKKAEIPANASKYINEKVGCMRNRHRCAIKKSIGIALNGMDLPRFIITCPINCLTDRGYRCIPRSMDPMKT